MKYLELPRTTKALAAYFIVLTISATIKSELITEHIDISIKSFFRLINYVTLPITLFFSVALIVATNLMVWNMIKIHQIFIDFSVWLITLQTTFKVLIISELFKLGLVYLFLLDDLNKKIISEDFMKNTFYFKLSILCDIAFYALFSVLIFFNLKSVLKNSIKTRILIGSYIFMAYTLEYIYYLT